MIQIDPRSAASLEDQLRSQIRELIVTGELVEGQALPSTRQLAADLTIHFNTVARAYRRLQDEGLVLVEQGRGVFVSKRPVLASDSGAELRRELLRRLRRVFVDAHLLGMSVTQMRDLVTSELDQFFAQEDAQ